MEQLDLLSSMDQAQALTVADIDEWIALTRATVNAHAAGQWPAAWARESLGALLGEEIPHRRWSTRVLLDTLARARAVAVEREG